MKTAILFCFCAVVVVALSIYFISKNSIVEYYENLINEETARAFTFSLPRDSSEFRTSSKEAQDYGVFDYIIVGAGSAGSVIANRLSENKKDNILLLEAGGYESNFSDIPAMDTFLQGLEFNWNYNSIPQTTSCLGMINRVCPYPRGKGLGGTSIINAMAYVRGNKIDYDNWEALGNPGWSYKDVLPFFIKSENSHIDGDEGYHGKDGNLNIEHPKPFSKQLYAFIEANLELGRKLVDYNGREQLGVSPVQSTITSGQRDSTGKAFLKPILNRPNLKILIHSLVTKVLINPLTKRAYGVLYSSKNKSYMAKARKEIIISGGTINSPQLLMLSGIGPKDHLEYHGIPVLESLAVGDNFQEHAAYYALIFETNFAEPIKPLEDYIKEYLNGYGPFTFAGNTRGLAFLQTKYAKISNYPDIEFRFVGSNNTNSYIKQAFRYNDESFNAVWAKIDPTRSFTIVIILLHPKSRGTIRLKSNDPFDYPLIDSQILSDSNNEDIETLYEGIQKALELLDTNAFKELNTTLMYAPLPICQKHEYLSKDYWFCQLRQLTFNLYHPIGTCKMGPNPADGAVVNHELKVHGVKGLRVADASVIPLATSGHTNAPAIMIGEKASYMIMNSECCCLYKYVNKCLLFVAIVLFLLM